MASISSIPCITRPRSLSGPICSWPRIPLRQKRSCRLHTSKSSSRVEVSSCVEVSFLKCFSLFIRSQFHFVQHSEFLVSISKEDAQIEVNCYGIIRSMINRNQGIIEVIDFGVFAFAFVAAQDEGFPFFSFNRLLALRERFSRPEHCFTMGILCRTTPWDFPQSSLMGI